MKETSLSVTVECAMKRRDLIYFTKANAINIDLIVSIAKKNNDVLFARLCYIRGCKFNDVDPQLCTQEFALFMIQIMENTDEKYYEFMKKACSDKLSYCPKYEMPVGDDEEEAIVMMRIKTRSLDCAEIFNRPTPSVNALSLAIIWGFKPNFDQLLTHYLRTEYEPFARFLKSYPEKIPIEEIDCDLSTEAHIIKECRLSCNFEALKTPPKSDLIARFGNYKMAEHFNLSVKKVVNEAMKICNISFFDADTPLQLVALSAVKQNNVLFARWCYVRGWNFKEVDVKICTPRFALFMAQIDEERRNFFLKRVFDDDYLLRKITFFEKEPYIFADDVDITKSMFYRKTSNSYFYTRYVSKEERLLDILLGYNKLKACRFVHFKKSLEYFLAMSRDSDKIIALLKKITND